MRIVRQLLRWSALGWFFTLMLTGFYLLVSDRAFPDALFGGALSRQSHFLALALCSWARVGSLGWTKVGVFAGWKEIAGMNRARFSPLWAPHSS